MPSRRPARKATTTEKGLGWPHQQAVARLMRKLADGTLCWWCGLPMFLDKQRNWDRKALAGDHTVPRVAGGTLADRLLHGTCNSQRQDGRCDDQRPVVQGIHPRDWTAGDATVSISHDEALAMDW
ncbi:MAG: hypothetical protein ACPGVG_18090 [Mycobacterium sp.]